MDTELSELEELIGYRFLQKDLLKLALTHSSYANEHNMSVNNERLEFLGDAVLEIVSSDYLYHKFPDEPEGNLTKMRASIVCQPSLAFLCRNFNLGKFLRLGKGENATGGRKRPSVLSDAFEAVIGAVYLDGGYDAACSFVERNVMNHMEHMQLFRDSKTVLQEIVQGENLGELEYQMVHESGPDHNKIFEVKVVIGGKDYGSGEAHNKKSAEQEAAYQTILQLKK